MSEENHFLDQPDNPELTIVDKIKKRLHDERLNIKVNNDMELWEFIIKCDDIVAIIRYDKENKELIYYRHSPYGGRVCFFRETGQKGYLERIELRSEYGGDIRKNVEQWYFDNWDLISNVRYEQK